MLKSHMLKVKIQDFRNIQRIFHENSAEKQYQKAPFYGTKHMLIATSTQMLSAVQNPVLRCLMGDMLNGGAPVYMS